VKLEVELSIPPELDAEEIRSTLEREAKLTGAAIVRGELTRRFHAREAKARVLRRQP
jgi:hypothetical protein